ncbi:MAG: hypothetical protein DWQ04_11025 [Chloroflexi bacterium]|nr:MAG: hypothetical protein DWQ04_11025 [Chloroflexota bacterium]
MKRPSYNTGCYYHLYNRGRSRLSICHNHNDFMDIVARMKENGRKYLITIIAYVLLPNHYHILVRQDGLPRASLLPQRIFNVYSKTYNKKYAHSGTIFEGPAKGKLVHSQSYLLHLCRYIHANPVLHGISRTIDDWPYSNYHEWVQTRDGKLIDRAFVCEHFPTSAHYREFVFDFLCERKHPDGLDYLDEW